MSTPQRVAALCALALCAALAPRAAAQVDMIGGGCTVPLGGTPGIPDASGQRPELGNFDFRLSFTCPPSSTTIFALVGRCPQGPDFGLFPDSPCGSGCGQRVDAKGLNLVGSELTGRIRNAAFPFALPDLPSLRGARICVQFLCFDLAGDKPRCLEISQGVRIVPM